MINLSNEIAKILSEYSSEVEQGLEKAKQDVARKGAEELRKTSPKKTGEYAKGWTTRKDGNARIIYNKTKPQLTHLLEKGHAKRGGGRVAGIPHIRPVEEKVIDDFVERVEKVIRG